MGSCYKVVFDESQTLVGSWQPTVQVAR